MKNWQETETIYQRLNTLTAHGEAAALAVIVGIEGSTYRRPGAKLLIEADGRMIGNVSGGCLEQDVRETALSILKTGEARRVHYDTSDEEDKVWGMGLGCNGKVDLFIQRITPEEHTALIEEVCVLLQGDNPVAIRVDLEGDRSGRLSLVDPSETCTEWKGAVFTEHLNPPPVFLICGAGEDAIPLARMAHEIGFRVALADHRAAYLTSERFPWARKRVKARPEESLDELSINPHTLAVVKTHTLSHDAAWVNRLLETEVPYIGLLGPRDRRDEIRNRVDPAQQARIYGPVGLDLGGEGPEQVALSIVSEALAVWHGRLPGHLRDRTRAIHSE